jgi:hypothetical protein
MDQEQTAFFDESIDPNDTSGARMLETTESMELMAQDMQREEIGTPSSSSDGSKDESQRLVRAESKDENVDHHFRALLLNTTNDSSMLDKKLLMHLL